MLFGWLPSNGEADTREVLAAMRRVLTASGREPYAGWCERGFALGALDSAPLDGEPSYSMDPAGVRGRFRLWMSGEAFAWPSHGDVSAPESRTRAFRERLLDAFLRKGPAAVRDLDGEYQIAIWDGQLRRLVLLNDRFGALPLYWMRTPHGLAFAGGVRGVLVAPGARVEPDLDAIREAVTFGGFRLRGRTNVREVTMLPGASALSYDGSDVRLARYWRWADIPSRQPTPIADVIAELRAEWTRAVTARLAGARRPGLTLSGGLDSRAILAEAARHVPVSSVTYGVPASDDVRIAKQAAGAAGSRWTCHELYAGRAHSWLEHRESFIQQTDGLMDLVDLMHTEAIHTLASEVDLNLSGFVGDAVTGPTFNTVRAPEQVALALPYYGGRLGLDWQAAVDLVRTLVADLGGAPARFALFDQKIPQSTNRITAVLRPFVRVRRPFVDYRVFDLAQGQSEAIRGEGALHDRWLRTTYPGCFARIPHQKTGVPPLTPPWLRQATRVARYAARIGATRLASLGFPLTPPTRQFHADAIHWRTLDARERIEGTILRPGSIVAEVFGRAAVQSVLTDWFERLAAPTQVVGALFVYEAYHRDLARTVRQAQAVTPEDLCSPVLR